MPGRESQLVSAQEIHQKIIEEIQSPQTLLSFLEQRFCQGDGLYLEILASYLRSTHAQSPELQQIALTLIQAAFCGFYSLEGHFKVPLRRGAISMFAPENITEVNSLLGNWTREIITTKQNILRYSEFVLNEQEQLQFWASYRPNSSYPKFNLTKENNQLVLPKGLIYPRCEIGLEVYDLTKSPYPFSPISKVHLTLCENIPNI